jgi:hypothetical protein
MESAAQIKAESNKHGRLPEGLSGVVVETNQVTSARMTKVAVDGAEIVKQASKEALANFPMLATALRKEANEA